MIQRGTMLKKIGESIELPAISIFSVKDEIFGCSRETLPVGGAGEEMKFHFMGLVEKDVSARKLQEFELQKHSLDDPIISMVGGKEKATITFAHAHQYLKTADRIFHYLFYIDDIEGQCVGVYAYWTVEGWDFYACPLWVPFGWHRGVRILAEAV